MPPSSLALLAALVWGSSDFVAGRSTRAVGAVRVILWTATASTVVGLLATPFLPMPKAMGPAVGWGVAGGIGAGLGALALYHGMAHGRTALVAPLSALVAAGGPVLVGLVVGERPGVLAWVGIAMALPSVWLLGSGGTGAATGGVKYGLLAGAGFALFFICFGNAPEDAGMWPLVAARAASMLGAVIFLVGARRPARVERNQRLPLIVVGSADAVASGLFLFATIDGLVSLASVLASLYPVPTVLMAVFINREKVAAHQWLGVFLAVAAAAAVSI